MNYLRRRINTLRSVALEPQAAAVIDNLVENYDGFEKEYGNIEELLAIRPDAIGMRGVVINGLGVALYLHLSAVAPPLDILYRYNEETVIVETICVGDKAMPVVVAESLMSSG